MSSLARRRVAIVKNLVGFEVAGVRYAVPIERVREIIRPLEVVPLPHAPPAVLGVADHRGEVLAVLDVRRRFGLPALEDAGRTKWILVELGSRGVALVVDGVTEVFGTDARDERGVPELGIGDAARGIGAVYSHGGSLVFVIDVERVAAAAEVLDMSAIEGAMDRSSA